ncbi:hypothetical protein FJT64_025566 [Amphibalanus amphitrite]|uniref:Uncharacterized protein n=1 Tax=Amphibalanus amphitrite TaxID=1232801 RepID=A0A6A4W4S7_AMPAM|nr:hypothetical protein FJT64_025566 [Amphibalanus amphitrite]
MGGQHSETCAQEVGDAEEILMKRPEACTRRKTADRNAAPKTSLGMTKRRKEPRARAAGGAAVTPLGTAVLVVVLVVVLVLEVVLGLVHSGLVLTLVLVLLVLVDVMPVVLMVVELTLLVGPVKVLKVVIPPALVTP